MADHADRRRSPRATADREDVGMTKHLSAQDWADEQDRYVKQGWAVVSFTPTELDGVDAGEVMDSLSKMGIKLIDDIKGRRSERPDSGPREGASERA